MFFPFRGYGDPFRPAGAAYMPNILLLQSSMDKFILELAGIRDCLIKTKNLENENSADFAFALFAALKS